MTKGKAFDITRDLLTNVYCSNSDWDGDAFHRRMTIENCYQDKDVPALTAMLEDVKKFCDTLIKKINGRKSIKLYNS